MMAGVVAGQARLLAPVSAALWTPLNMTVVPQIYLDAQDSVVTDVSGFASAISNLGAMGSNGDFSQITAANRPAILPAALNGKQALSFDGLDDSLVGGSEAVKAIFKGVSAAFAFFVYRKRGVDVSGANRTLLFSSVGTSTGLNRFSVFSGLSSAFNRPSLGVRRLDGDAGATMSATAAHSVYTMALGYTDYSTRLGRIYIDGGVPTENAALTLAVGITSDTPSLAAIRLCASEGTSYTDADLAAVVISNVVPAEVDVDKLFGWAAHKYGLTANLPGGHPYKTAAPTV